MQATSLIFSLMLLLSLPFAARAAFDGIDVDAITDDAPPQNREPVRTLQSETAAEPVATTTTSPSSDYKRWFVIIPGFVIHGLDPSGGANEYMPRRMTEDGRFVATPGIGAEYQGRSSFEAAIAFVKDCYDHPAGALQIGQHWRVGATWDFGYSLGVYMRQTPILCLTSTVVTQTPASPTPPGLNLGGGRRGQPARTNTLSTTRCAFQDNLPLRYTTRVGSGFMDVIPTPFLHASVRLYHGWFDLHLKMISNFYLNEFGLSVPF